MQQVLMHQNFSLKSNVDKFDIVELKNVPTNLSNLVI